MSAGSDEGGMHANPAVVSVIPRGALADLNWLRGLAALAVLASHVRGLFFKDPRLDIPFATNALYVLTDFGHQAVVVFFVLSGFFIGTTVVVPSREGNWSWKRFLLRRLSRLYVVLLPALALTWAWDTLGTTLFGVGGVYSGHIQASYLALPDLRATGSLRALLGTLVFLQDFCVVPFGSNGPLWSLSYEFWTYMTFPLLYRAAAGDAPAPLRVASALSATAILVVFGAMFRFYFCVWGLGALVAIALGTRSLGTKNEMLSTVAIALFTAALLVAEKQTFHQRLLEDFMLGAATAVLVAVRVAIGRGASPESDGVPADAVARTGHVLAGFSYTLYASHYPVLTFLQAWLVGPVRWNPDVPRILVAILIGVGIVVVYAYPLARLTEARTDDVRRWLQTRTFFGPARSVGG